MSNPHTIKSVVTLMKTSYSRINQLNDSSFTALQKKSAEENLRNRFTNEGITYSFCGDDDPKYTFVLFNFESSYVEDTGLIVDVNVEGNHPIRLTASESVSIDFEPRDISHLDSYAQRKINNAEFMHLRKGAAFAFGGKLVWGRYYVQTERVELRVDSQHRTTLGKLLRRFL
jgi:hypothetical protein